MFIKIVERIISLLYFYSIKFFFKKSEFLNYISYKSKIRGKNNITIGANNIIKDYATILVDSQLYNQYITIGDNNIISEYAILRSQMGYIKVGNNNFFGEKVQVQGRGGVVIGNNCMIAANTFVSSSNHDYSMPNTNEYLKKEIPEKTLIGDYVWIGANVVVTAGVYIGHHSIIGAGSVVTKNIEPYTMVAGNPNKLIKKYCHQEKKWIKV